MAFSKEFKRLLKIWHESGAWRKYSFEDFLLELAKTIEKNEQLNGKKQENPPVH